jgi:hypothetical protein
MTPVPNDSDPTEQTEFDTWAEAWDEKHGNSFQPGDESSYLNPRPRPSMSKIDRANKIARLAVAWVEVGGPSFRRCMREIRNIA